MNNPTFLPQSSVTLPGAGRAPPVGGFSFRFGAGAPAPAAPSPLTYAPVLANAPFNWLTLSPLPSQSSAHRV